MFRQLDKSRPICPQICERICVSIANGELKPGERLLSVREVASDSGVNPNTVQKAFQILSGEGLLYSEPGSGWFVGMDTSIAVRRTEEIYREKVKTFFEEMGSIGMPPDKLKEYIGGWKNE